MSERTNLSSNEYGAYQLTYDQIVELIVDIDNGESMNKQRVLAALRELQQRRIDERVAHNLALARADV